MQNASLDEVGTLFNKSNEELIVLQFVALNHAKYFFCQWLQNIFRCQWQRRPGCVAGPLPTEAESSVIPSEPEQM